MRRLLLLTLASLALAAPAYGQTPVVYRIAVNGTVENGLAPYVARALREAELVVGVINREPAIAEALRTGIAASGVYRLLFRALISDPGEVRSFFEDTVEPLVSYDRQYRSDLLGTLEEYLASDCNMNATARAIYAHRHTVAYRLERIRELTGLDPASSEDRERLGLGIKAYRILSPALPR